MARNPTLGELLRVDQHARREQEERDEQDAAHELDLPHQLASVRYEAVQREPGEEGTDDPLDPCAIGDEGRRGESDEDEQEPRAAVLPDTRRTPSGSRAGG